MSEKKLPLISIGVASFNNSKYILDTLLSIASQTYQHIELIIVDDNSNDNSVDIINNFLKTITIPFKFHINEKNTGVVSVCNKLLSLVTGEYYTLIGSDDIMTYNRIELQISRMLELDADMSFGDIHWIDENRNIINKNILKNKLPNNLTYIELTYNELIEYNFITAPSVMLKTEVVKNINGYNESYIIE
ncbi:MAG: glycosyltransferase, partial [Bacteroidia bacterium]|nr:glycosyltransferase [Bacteroidia bacterium]